MEFAVVVEGNGDTNDKSIWEGQISARVADATEILEKERVGQHTLPAAELDAQILLSLTTVKNVMVSMNEDWCHWAR